MTQPARGQPTNPPLPLKFFSPAQMVFVTTWVVTANAIAAAIFTAIPAVGGAVFGITYIFSARLIHWTCDKTGYCLDNIIFRVAQFALSTIGGIAAAALITTIVGFPMTMTAGIILLVTSVGVSLSTCLTLGGCLCSSAFVTGMALGNYTEQTSVY